MKYMFLSDIHGSIGSLRRALDFYTDARCDMLLLLGDIINYGPRNRIPDDIDPAAVAARLNSMRDDIVAVRGNCDSEVDQMLLKFPIMADYAVVTDGGRRIFITHGHIYNEDNMPVLRNGVFVYGHTHLWKLARREGCVVCNTGSVTFPKEGREPTFALYDDGVMSVRRLDGSVVEQLAL